MRDTLARAACTTSLEWQETLLASELGEKRELIEVLKTTLNDLKQMVMSADGCFKQWEQSPQPEHAKLARSMFDQCLQEANAIGLFLLASHWFEQRRPAAFAAQQLALIADDEQRRLEHGDESGGLRHRELLLCADGALLASLRGGRKQVHSKTNKNKKTKNKKHYPCFQFYLYTYVLNSSLFHIDRVCACLAFHSNRL